MTATENLQSSLRDWESPDRFPSDESLGYCHSVPPGRKITRNCRTVHLSGRLSTCGRTYPPASGNLINRPRDSRKELRRVNRNRGERQARATDVLMQIQRLSE